MEKKRKKQFKNIYFFNYRPPPTHIPPATSPDASNWSACWVLLLGRFIIWTTRLSLDIRIISIRILAVSGLWGVVLFEFNNKGSQSLFSWSLGVIKPVNHEQIIQKIIIPRWFRQLLIHFKVHFSVTHWLDVFLQTFNFRVWDFVASGYYFGQSLD